MSSARARVRSRQRNPIPRSAVEVAVSDDQEQAAADLLLGIPDAPGDNAATHPPGTCPDCGAAVARPDGCCGSWTGGRPNGMLAGGGFYQTACPGCGARLVAYFDVYDDEGNIPDRPADWEPAVVWQRDSG